MTTTGGRGSGGTLLVLKATIALKPSGLVVVSPTASTARAEPAHAKADAAESREDRRKLLFVLMAFSIECPTSEQPPIAVEPSKERVLPARLTGGGIRDEVWCGPGSYPVRTNELHTTAAAVHCQPCAASCSTSANPLSSTRSWSSLQTLSSTSRCTASPSIPPSTATVSASRGTSPPSPPSPASFVPS